MADDRHPTASDRTAGWALLAAGAMWVAVVGCVAVVVELGVPNPAELLADVAARPVVWQVSNVLLIVLPLVLALTGQRLLDLAGPALPHGAVVGPLALAGGALAASGVFHGVFGAHLAARVDDGVVDAELVRLAEIVHALGDTCWFVGVAALMVLMLVVTVGGRDRLDRRVWWIGVAAIVCNLAQFGWFFAHALGLFAGPGAVLQAAWFAALGAGVVFGTPAPAPTAPPADRGRRP
jgi:hypothetical protein